MSERDSLMQKENLAALDLKVLAVQRTQPNRWWNWKQVVSPFSRLWLILEGVAFTSHHGQEFTLKPGQFHLVPAFSYHDCHCPDSFDHYYVCFVTRLPTGIDLLSMLECQFQIPAPPHALASLERLEAIYPDRKLPCFDPFQEEYKKFPARVEREKDEVKPADWFESQGIMRLLLAPFLRSARPREDIHARAATRFLAVQEYIHEHMNERLSLPDLGRVAGLNPNYFSDLFQEVVGIRPMEYLARRRVERAQYLLATSAASIKEIAHEVGVPTPWHFTRFFTKMSGMSPSSYRAQHR